jgi:hypothetical protein
MGKISWRRGQRPNHVEAPTSERPGWWYGDEVLRRDASLPAEELAIGLALAKAVGQ